jgi:hypothetical protein
MIRTNGWRIAGRVLTGKITPDRRNCGASTSGMNWMIWSSVRANVDRKIPRLTAPTARSSTTRKASAGLPAAGSPRPIENAGSGPTEGTWIVPSAQSSSTMTWMVANSPNPSV